MPHSPTELKALIETCERSAEQHITYAKRAHTEFQRLFHERRAADDLLRASRHRDELRALVENDPPTRGGRGPAPDDPAASTSANEI